MKVAPVVNISQRMSLGPLQVTNRVKRKISVDSSTSIWCKLFLFYGIRLNNHSNICCVPWNLPLLFISVWILQLITHCHFLVITISDLIKFQSINAVAILVGFPIVTLLALVTSCIIFKKRHQLFIIFKNLSEKSANERDVPQRESIFHLILLIILSFLAIISDAIVISTLSYEARITIIQSFVLHSSIHEDMHQLVNAFIFIEYAVILITSIIFVNISVMFFGHVCKMLAMKFKNLNKEVEKFVNDETTLDLARINNIRQRHQRVCKLTNEVSQCFSCLIFIWMLGLLVNVCFNIRALNPTTLSFSSVYFAISYIMSILRDGYELFIIYSHASRVNQQAHASYNILVNFLPTNEERFTTSSFRQNQGADNLSQFSYNLFTQRLSGEKIGIVAGGFFVVTTMSALTACGSILTYIIVLYQTA